MARPWVRQVPRASQHKGMLTVDKQGQTMWATPTVARQRQCLGGATQTCPTNHSQSRSWCNAAPLRTRQRCVQGGCKRHELLLAFSDKPHTRLFACAPPEHHDACLETDEKGAAGNAHTQRNTIRIRPCASLPAHHPHLNLSPATSSFTAEAARPLLLDGA